MQNIALELGIIIIHESNILGSDTIYYTVTIQLRGNLIALFVNHHLLHFPYPA